MHSSLIWREIRQELFSWDTLNHAESEFCNSGDAALIIFVFLASSLVDANLNE